MNKLHIPQVLIDKVVKKFNSLNLEFFVLVISFLSAVLASIYSYTHLYTVAYGDAESHLNIAKRVIDSITPGFAQLGGIWLPLPHLFLIPFVYSDFLWRTGLSGAIISGICFIISALYIYKLTYLITKHRGASLFSALVFIFNPNILYMQSTPMTELTLIVFFILSSYYFISFLQKETILDILFAAFFAFCASLSRYDGWALVMMEAGVLALYYFPYQIVWNNLKSFKFRHIFVRRNPNESLKKSWERLEGKFIFFSTLAFFGILIWLAWDYLILGDALYFTHSQFSAKSQQQSWLARGELPAYHNILISFVYYFVTTISNVGLFVTLISVAGVFYFLTNKKNNHRFYVLMVLSVPFIFNVVTLYLGQSVIFIPSITPRTFEWTLFNVRYGLLMVPFVAFFVGYLFGFSRAVGRIILMSLFVFQFGLYIIGYSSVITLADGTIGLSSAVGKLPDAQRWLEKEYDHGMVLTDDFARTISIIRTKIPMKDVIYVGNKPYWEDSLTEPQKYATWIVMQKDDDVWRSVYLRPEVHDRLFKYFNKVYTSNEILIFKRMENVPNDEISTSTTATSTTATSTNETKNN